MICPYCGSEIENDVNFCTFCGRRISNENTQKKTSGRKVSGKSILAVAAILVIAIVIGTVVFLINNKSSGGSKSDYDGSFSIPSVFGASVNLQDYITVEISGCDGYGVAEVEFDDDKFMMDALEATGLTNLVTKYADYDFDELEDVMSSDEYNEIVNFIYAVESVDYYIDADSGLSNGDVVTVTFLYDSDLVSEAGLKFKDDSVSFNVSDLGETESIDPFEGVYIEYTGISPFLEASVVKESASTIVSEHVHFTLSMTTDIELGDVIIMSVDNDIDEFANKYGITFTETSRKFVCEDADFYVTDPDDISDEALEEMKSIVEDELYNCFDYNEEKCSNITYEGYCFLTLEDKTLNTGLAHNKVAVIFSANITQGEVTNEKYYFKAIFNNVITNSTTGESTVSTSIGAVPFNGRGTQIMTGVRGFTNINDLADSLESEYEEYYTMQKVFIN